jgi:hypothetical protein
MPPGRAEVIRFFAKTMLPMAAHRYLSFLIAVLLEFPEKSSIAPPIPDI